MRRRRESEKRQERRLGARQIPARIFPKRSSAHAHSRVLRVAHDEPQHIHPTLIHAHRLHVASRDEIAPSNHTSARNADALARRPADVPVPPSPLRAIALFTLEHRPRESKSSSQQNFLVPSLSSHVPTTSFAAARRSNIKISHQPIRPTRRPPLARAVSLPRVNSIPSRRTYARPSFTRGFGPSHASETRDVVRLSAIVEAKISFASRERDRPVRRGIQARVRVLVRGRARARSVRRARARERARGRRRASRAGVTHGKDSDRNGNENGPARQSVAFGVVTSRKRARTTEGKGMSARAGVRVERRRASARGDGWARWRGRIHRGRTVRDVRRRVRFGGR